MKTIRNKQRNRRIGTAARLLEQIEARVLLSGNVSAHVTSGLLYVQIDRYNDSVVIDQATLSANQFRVASGDGATTINGQASAAVYSGVTGIVITTGSGNDTITIQNASISAGLQITGTSGNQMVTLNGVSVGGDFSLTSGGGENSTVVEGSSVNGNISLNAGGGFNGQCGNFWGSSCFANAYQIFTLTGSSVGNNVSISNVSGETTTDIESSTIGGNLTASNGGSSYGTCGFNAGHGCGGSSSPTSGDLFTVNFSTIGNNVSVSNASDGNSTDIEESSINGSVSVANDVASNTSCGFYSCGGSNIANASDAFTLNGSSIGTDLTLANVSDGATAAIVGGSTVGGNLNINNGVGSYKQGYTICTGASSKSSDTLTVTDSTIVNNVLVNNGSTYNVTDIETSTIAGSLTVNDDLNSTGNCGSCCNSSSANTTDLFTLSGSTVGVNVSVSNASGYTKTSIEDSLVGANVVVIDSTGTAYFNMDGSTVVGNLTFVAGKGVTYVDVTNSVILDNATITVAPGANVVISPSEVGGVLVVN